MLTIVYLRRVPSPVTTAAAARELLEGIGGGTSPERGSEIYDFIREQRPHECLELGFAHGVGTVYMAAALEANGAGRVTSVDIPSVLERVPTAEETVERAGLAHRVELVVEQTSYNWFLQRKLREQRTRDDIEPLYDFVFLDGAHTWADDGLAFALVDRLLRPGGWILFDDLDWRLGEDSGAPAEERELAQVKEVWELLVVTHPSYDEIRTDGSIGWARKSPDAATAVRTVYRQDILRSVRELARYARSRARRVSARSGAP